MAMMLTTKYSFFRFLESKISDDLYNPSLVFSSMLSNKIYRTQPQRKVKVHSHDVLKKKKKGDTRPGQQCSLPALFFLYFPIKALSPTKMEP